AWKTLPGRYTAHLLDLVNSKWNAVYKLYRNIEPAPPLHYLDSLELALVLKDEVDDADVRAIFACGRPLEFWGCPRLLVSNIVEAFNALQDEPTYLDVTITALFELGSKRPSEAWAEVYRIHLPCYACTSVESVEERSIPRLRYPGWEHPNPGTVDFAVEKFHVSSKTFRKRLTVELHYPLVEGTTEAEQDATLLLLPEYASDVFGFLDRAHVGPSLLSNRHLRNLICQLKQRLPVHHLKGAFEKVLLGRGRIRRGTYWLTIRHFQRALPYTRVRRFRLPSAAGPKSDCDLIRRYLSNSHVDDIEQPQANFSFTIKMLASLAAGSVTVGRVRLNAVAERLSDYRSIDSIFGGLRMSDLYLSCYEHRFVELVKITDFFRMSTIQGLRELKLTLSEPWNEEQKPRGRAGSKSPLWISGIYLLLNCEYYRVEYRSHRHLRSIERKIVQICEKFERGEITDTVEHFHFKYGSEKGMNFAFSRDNLLVAGMKVEGTDHRNLFPHIEWDVYRFRNASTGCYLTACVGHNPSIVETVLHIVRGEVYPNASFAEYIDDDDI
ncbi:hypothetical protein AAVH_36317, partial [Aphelenchoides avenae]